MTEDKAKIIENSLNELISEAVKNGGHLWIVDKKHNNFALRLTEDVKLQFWGGYKGDRNE